MRALDDMELVKLCGVSRELTEHTHADAVIENDYSDGYNWSIRLYTPTERDDIKYFIVYPDCITGEYPMFSSKKCARISIYSPEYIHCSDCTKEEWILNYDEKEHLCKILNTTTVKLVEGEYFNLETLDAKEIKTWDYLLYEYGRTLLGYNDDIRINLKGLPMPDYMQLPER